MLGMDVFFSTAAFFEGLGIGVAWLLEYGRMVGRRLGMLSVALLLWTDGSVWTSLAMCVARR